VGIETNGRKEGKMRYLAFGFGHGHMAWHGSTIPALSELMIAFMLFFLLDLILNLNGCSRCGWMDGWMGKL
jgi:hypothetical protein